MVEVEKYIKRLLYDQDCVIIPNFGGVITHYLPARFDSATGKYLPSQRKVAFNEVLKVDDGLLAKFISQNEGMSHEQAQRHIKDFIQTVQALLKKNKAVTLNGIGLFQQNAEGRLVFQPDLTRNFHSEFYGLQPVAAVDRKASALERVNESGITPSVASEDIPVVPSRKLSWGNWISAASIACVLVYVSAVLSQEPGATSSLNPIETIRSLFVSAEPSTSKSEGVGAYSVLAAEDLKSEEEVVNDVDNSLPAEHLVEKASVVASVVENSAHRFHVIASVYESKSSLEKYGKQMAGKLRGLGYEEIEMLSVRDRYMLSAGSYATWDEAQKVIPALNKTAKGAWIYKKR
jgi:hypothetical protein